MQVLYCQETHLECHFYSGIMDVISPRYLQTTAMGVYNLKDTYELSPV